MKTADQARNLASRHVLLLREGLEHDSQVGAGKDREAPLGQPDRGEFADLLAVKDLIEHMQEDFSRGRLRLRLGPDDLLVGCPAGEDLHVSFPFLPKLLAQDVSGGKRGLGQGRGMREGARRKLLVGGDADGGLGEKAILALEPVLHMDREAAHGRGNDGRVERSRPCSRSGPRGEEEGQGRGRGRVCCLGPLPHPLLPDEVQPR